MEQNRRPRQNPCSYSHFILNKGAPKYALDKNTSSINGAGKTGYSPARERIDN
jgi:hypothetical protein